MQIFKDGQLVGSADSFDLFCKLEEITDRTGYTVKLTAAERKIYKLNASGQPMSTVLGHVADTSAMLLLGTLRILDFLKAKYPDDVAALNTLEEDAQLHLLRQALDSGDLKLAFVQKNQTHGQSWIDGMITTSTQFTNAVERVDTSEMLDPDELST